MKPAFREYSAIVWKFKWAALLVIISVTTATVIDTIVPLFYKDIANALADPFSQENYRLLISAFLKIMGSFIAIWFCWRLVEIGIIPLEAGGMRELDKRSFRTIAAQKYRYFEDNFSGSIIKRSARFTHAYERIVDWFIFSLLPNTVAIVVAFAVFYHQEPAFALYFLLWIILFLGWATGFSIWKLRFHEVMAQWESKIGGAYSDAISNIFSVKSFALEPQEQKIIDETAETTFKKRRLAWILDFVSFAVQGILSMGIELILIYGMIQKWREGEFSVGEFILFQTVMLLLIHRLWDFGRSLRSLFSAIADANEMGDMYASTDLDHDYPGSHPVTLSSGAIEFRNITFSYGPQNPLFNHFNLRIKAGEKIALVGASGSGKTSLTKLLFRFIEAEAGDVYFDGIPGKQFTLESLRRQISLVPQQPELFHRSIKDNITLGKPVDEATLRDTAEKAKCLEFINKLPKQFDTLVGERGVKLSGGEKQRVAIARAFLEEAPIVVLDEATSALDSLTEKQIQAAIFRLIEEKTAIVIAHRLSTILKMDRIVVLENGKILEEGTHRSLLEHKGHYYRMWQHQSGEFLGDY